MKITTKVNDVKQTAQITRYAPDFETAIANEMESLNMTALPIEQTETFFDAETGEEKVKTSFVYEYGKEHDNIVLKRIHTLRPEVPETPSTVSTNSWFSDYQADYHKEAEYTYNQYGKPVIENRKTGTIIFYVWAHQNAYPVVVAETNLSVADSLENKIEEDYYYFLDQIDLILKLANIGGFEEIQSFAEPQSVSKWSLFNTKLRAFFADYNISTYTYLPLVGMTSGTNAEGKTTYFEYDGAGRLRRIKDHNGSIVKTYKYNYIQTGN